MLFIHGGLCETLSQNLAARWFNEQTFVLCPVSLHFFGICRPNVIWIHPFPSLKPEVQGKVMPCPKVVPVFQADHNDWLILGPIRTAPGPSAEVRGETTSVVQLAFRVENACLCWLAICHPENPPENEVNAKERGPVRMRGRQSENNSPSNAMFNQYSPWG